MVYLTKENPIYSFEEYLAYIKTAKQMINSFENGGDLTYDESSALKIGDVRYDVKVKDVPILKGHLQVLDNDGNVIYNMAGRERIFSILDTNDITTKVLEIDEGASLEELWLIVSDIFDKHAENKKQYVKK